MDINISEQAIVTLSVSVSHKTYRKFFLRWMWHRCKVYFTYLSLYILLFVAVILLIFIKPSVASALPLMISLMQYLLPRHFYAKHFEIYQGQTTTEFCETHYRSRCNAMGTVHDRVTPYEHCTAMETQSAFYLYYHKKRRWPLYTERSFDPDPYNASAILDKEYLTDEQQQTLRELFTRKFGESFKQYNQK